MHPESEHICDTLDQRLLITIIPGPVVTSHGKKATHT